MVILSNGYRSLPLFASILPKNFQSLSESNFQVPGPAAYDAHRSYQTVVPHLSAAHAEGQPVQVRPESCAILAIAGLPTNEGDPESVQKDLCFHFPFQSAIDGSKYKKEKKKEGTAYALIHNLMLLTIIEHLLIPFIPFIPPILYHLDLSHFLQSSKYLYIIRIAHPDHKDFSLIL